MIAKCEKDCHFLKSLLKVGYFERKVATEEPVISFEVKPLADEDPELVVANAKRTFLAAWNTIFPILWKIKRSDY